MNDLTFKQLTSANLARDRDIFHEMENWSLADWATALAGEVGEACNKIKKLKYGRHALLRKVAQADITHLEIAKELADAVIYADILCQLLGYGLGEVIRLKFNHVSDEVGSLVKL
jgi:NTP pyrophosphatase (non-canonical NTP hydrolase)